MTFILTKLVWKTLAETPNLIISQTFSLILLGLLIIVTIEKGLVDISSKNKDEVKLIFNSFIAPMLIIFVFIIITRFIPLIY